MKNTVIIFFTTAICCLCQRVYAQSINWSSLQQDQEHFVTVNAGWDYGVVTGIGYSYQLKSKVPALVMLSYSIPSGEKPFDDFKAKTGGKVRIYRIRDFQFSAGGHVIYRRYENQLVYLQNFGAEVTGAAGYYKTRWYVAAEGGFDKAVVTRFSHTGSFKEFVYNEVKDGWFQPSTGGNFQFGIQTGYSSKQHDITFRIGKAISQDLKTPPLIPYYLQLGYNLKIRGKRK